MTHSRVALLAVTFVSAVSILHGAGQAPPTPGLEAKVMAFLDANRDRWRDMNVPEDDGRALHDIIVKGRYTRALEIGTSTGRSGIWIALALSKTGGRLITIDIDPGRHAEARRNFAEAGVSAFIDARLGDAHELVPALPGPFDFVFVDADKDWYTNYAKAVLPKLLPGGCLAAHNVYPGRGWRNMTGDYHDYVSARADLQTTVTPGGLAVSYKRPAK
jgi:predicted O-methyltransferase YrrM